MTTTINKRAIPPPREAPNRQAIEALATATNELSGAIGDAMQRAVRVCELVDAGILALMPNGQLGRSESVDSIGIIDDVTGLTAALAGKVNKAGDMMTGPPIVNADISIGGDGRLIVGDAVFDSNGDTIRWFGHPSGKVMSWNRATGALNVPGAAAFSGNGNLGLGYGNAALNISGAWGGGIRMLDGSTQAGIWMQNDPSLRFGVSATTGGLTELLRLSSTDPYRYATLYGGIDITGGGATMILRSRTGSGAEAHQYNSDGNLIFNFSGIGDRFWMIGNGDFVSSAAIFPGGYGSCYLYRAASNMLGINQDMVVGGTLDVVSQLYARGWLRTQYSGFGWYHEAHGGGWYMTDNNWIRSYNNKGVLISGGPNGRQLHLEGASVSLQVYDTDRSTYSWLHYNDGQFGFLAENSFSWAAYRTSGNEWHCIGNVAAYASDRRLKTAIENVDRSKIKVFFDDFQVREFDWNQAAIDHLNPGFNPTAWHEIGAIAQEVEEFAPWMVNTHTHNGIKTIMWDKAVPYLISEVQALRTERDELRERLDRIERLLGLT